MGIGDGTENEIFIFRLIKHKHQLIYGKVGIYE